MTEQVISDAAALAGKMADAVRPIIRDIWLAPKQVNYKDDGSLLTQADLAQNDP